MRYVIAGGAGFLGQALSAHLSAPGDEVSVLSRSPQAESQMANSGSDLRRPERTSAQAPVKRFVWDGENPGEWESALDEANVLINLAGKSVNCRYGEENKRRILESRTKSTAILGEAVARCKNPPKLWINSSTATIYRHAEDRPMDEDAGEVGSDFSMTVAIKWEEAFFGSSPCPSRRVAMRSSMVMGCHKNSAFTYFKTLVKMGLGGPEGSGRQMVSWIHVADWLSALEWVINHEELEGAINITSPNPLPNTEFLRTLRREMRVPVGLPLPKWTLKIGAFFLGTETELILKSRWVLPKRLQESGFEFQYPEWKNAAADLLYHKF